MMVKLLSNIYVNLSIDNLEYISEPSIDNYSCTFYFEIRTKNDLYTVEKKFCEILNRNPTQKYHEYDKENPEKLLLDKYFIKFKVYYKNLIDFINTKDTKYLTDNERLLKNIDLKK